MNHKISAIGILICLIITQLSAQNASIRGIITGGDNQEGLVGVNILLKSTVHGTVSGLHGDYILRDIPAGKQTLILVTSPKRLISMRFFGLQYPLQRLIRRICR